MVDVSWALCFRKYCYQIASHAFHSELDWYWVTSHAFHFQHQNIEIYWNMCVNILEYGLIWNMLLSACQSCFSYSSLLSDIHSFLPQSLVISQWLLVMPANPIIFVFVWIFNSHRRNCVFVVLYLCLRMSHSGHPLISLPWPCQQKRVPDDPKSAVMITIWMFLLLLSFSISLDFKSLLM